MARAYGCDRYEKAPLFVGLGDTFQPLCQATIERTKVNFFSLFIGFESIKCLESQWKDPLERPSLSTGDGKKTWQQKLRAFWMELRQLSVRSLSLLPWFQHESPNCWGQLFLKMLLFTARVLRWLTTWLFEKFRWTRSTSSKLTQDQLYLLRRSRCCNDIAKTDWVENFPSPL